MVASVLIGAGVIALLAYWMSDHWARTYDKWFGPASWTDDVDIGRHTPHELYEFAAKHSGSKQSNGAPEQPEAPQAPGRAPKP